MDRIRAVTNDCFNAIHQLRRMEAGDGLAPAHVHARVRHYVDHTIEAAKRAGFAHEDVQAIVYALCSLADEVVLTRRGPLRDFWVAQPLQLLYFDEHLAGEHFFHHLDAIRRDPRRAEIVRVYYLCLLFGFQGRYRVRGAEVALDDYVEHLRHEVVRSAGASETLSPEGLRPDELLVRVTRGAPVVWLSVGLVALAALLYVGMRVALDDALAQMIAWMSTFARS